MKLTLRSLLFLASGALAHTAASAPVLIDFGAAAARTDTTDGVVWNNVDEHTQRTLIGLVLLDSEGTQSGIQLTMDSPFAGANRNGTTKSATNYPASATSDSLYANIEPYEKQENVTPVLRLTGLEPAKEYILTFFASRNGPDNRSARYSVTGADSMTVELDAAAKEAISVSTPPIAPRLNGSLTIVISPAVSNNTNNHFTYLSVLEIRLAE